MLDSSGLPKAETFGRYRKFSAFGLRFRPPNIKSEYGRKLNFRFTKTFTKKEKEVHLFLCCESWQLVRFICWLHAPWEFHYSVVTAKNGLRKPSLIFLVNTIKGTYSTLWIEINQGRYYFVQKFSKNLLFSHIFVLSVSVFGLRPNVFPVSVSVSAESEKHTFGHSLVWVMIFNWSDSNFLCMSNWICCLADKSQLVTTILMWESMPECIYNPIMAMGFSAMFTFQLDNTKR